MLKQELSYEDFDGNIQSETLYFNLTTSELADNMELKDELDKIQESLSGEERALTPDEVRRILNLVKTLMRLSYGVRSEDGKRFKKNPQSEVWDVFTETAAYDAYVTSLFTNPEKAIEFMLGIMPANLREAAEKQAAVDNTRTIENAEVREISLDTQPNAFNQPAPQVVPAWEAEGRNPTTAELQSMSPEELQKAFAKRVSQNNLK